MNLIDECEKGNLENVKYLVKNGSDISVFNYLPLIITSMYDNLEIVKYLVEQGSDISVDNYAPLRYASMYGYGNLEIVNYFRKVLGNKIPCYDCLVRPTCLELCF